MSDRPRLETTTSDSVQLLGTHFECIRIANSLFVGQKETVNVNQRQCAVARFTLGLYEGLLIDYLSDRMQLKPMRVYSCQVYT